MTNKTFTVRKHSIYLEKLISNFLEKFSSISDFFGRFSSPGTMIFIRPGVTYRTHSEKCHIKIFPTKFLFSGEKV